LAGMTDGVLVTSRLLPSPIVASAAISNPQ